MDITYLVEHWTACRLALHRHFPQYGFSETAPNLDELRFALDGLAVVTDLTPDELVDTLVDYILFAPPLDEAREAA